VKGDYLSEAKGHTLTKRQILEPIVRTLETLAEQDEGLRKLADQLHAVLVDPSFDLDAPVDLADLMGLIAEPVVDLPEPSEAPRRDEFPGGPQ
jgi:hypothetical protein